MASSAAKRYAEAVFEVAQEKGALDAWQHDLSLLNDLMSNPQAAAFFANPNVTPAHKRQIVDEVLADAQPEARNLAHLLVERHRMELVPDIYQDYSDAHLAAQGIAVADVTTAEPLGKEEQELVRAQLGRIVGKEIRLRLHTDPAIIGGVIARVGDMLIDGSVVNQLRRLRTRLAAAT
jgi:F-type H+-transporting ATPase subunit delta